MRIIDKTPFVSPDGTISFLDRIQGTLQNGFSWYPELQAQQVAISSLDKHLDKKYTLIRNQTLEKSRITLPLTLIGPAGIFVLYVTHLNGMYRARGDIWGELDGGKLKIAKINLLTRTAQLGRVLGVYFKKQGYEKIQPVESVLLSVNPGLHVESVRPIVRVVLSDAIQRFAMSVIQSPPVLSVEMVHQLVEVLQKPQLDQKVAPASENIDSFSFQDSPKENYSQRLDGSNSQLSQAGTHAVPHSVRPVVAKKVSNSYLGMTGKQFALLGAMVGELVCVLVIFILFVLAQTAAL